MDPEEVQIGETIVVRAGERIPLDGTIIEGASSLDTSALTGESLPREVAAGEDVISGCINQSGTLQVRVSKIYGESTVAKILDLVENASSKKVQVRSFHHSLCKILHAPSRYRRSDSGCAASADQRSELCHLD